MSSESVFILKSGSCFWGKCVFCGYGRIQGVVYSKTLNREFDKFFDNLGECSTVKVYGSGSFLDEKQVPRESREHFIVKCIEKEVTDLAIESRPEYITPEKLKEFTSGGVRLTVGIGLEVADDNVLDKIKKGFHLEDYEKAAAILHGNDCRLKTYLLVNPPYVDSVQESLDKSVEYALKYSDEIVLINTLPHRDARLFQLWVNGEWNYLSRKEFMGVTRKWGENPVITLDVETFKFTPRFPKSMQEPLAGVGEEYLTHPYFEVWQDYIVRWYQPPPDRDILLILPCSYTKPYSQSQTHRKINEILRKTPLYDRMHQVMVSNPGLIPREFEDTYPFNKYDWSESKETLEIKKRYVEVTTDRITKYLLSHKRNYRIVCCILKHSSESYKALEKACNNAGIELHDLLGDDRVDDLRSSEALNKIEENLECLQRNSM